MKWSSTVLNFTSSSRIYFSESLEALEGADGVHLLQDHIGTYYKAPWNDVGYVITFQVYVVSGKASARLGITKVLVKGCENTADWMRACAPIHNDRRDITDSMRINKVVSLSSHVDFYKRMSSLSRASVELLLAGICDASYFYSNRSRFERWGGFEDAVCRSSAAKAVMRNGSQIALGQHVSSNGFELAVSPFQYGDSVKFSFGNNRKVGEGNVNLLIGRNGCGKSRTLRRLVEQLTSRSERDYDNPFIHKVVVAAYSPFEEFRSEAEVLGASDPENEVGDDDVGRRRRSLVNEYAYIGFRDPSGKFSLDWPKEASARALIRIIDMDFHNVAWGAESRLRLLYRTLRQAFEFDAISLGLVGGGVALISEPGEDWSPRSLVVDNIDLGRGISFIKDDAVLGLSSGQIIYSYLLPCLVAEVDDESLIVLDEPELYLHPTMELGLMKMLKVLLKATRSNAVIATHSGIVAREVDRSSILVMRKSNGFTSCDHPSIETYGESVDVIIGHVFDDYQQAKPFEGSVDAAAAKFSTLNEALASLSGELGDLGVARLASRFDCDDEPNVVRRELS